jgi:dinuclear metal center YbgI/SA1388 family protein
VKSKGIDAYFRSVLDIAGFAETDISLNGIQVDNDGGDIKKIAFATDACMETFKRAVACGAGMLFVHHGLYWGKPLRIEKSFRNRIDFLLRNNLALYAAHLPLDAHDEIGNNGTLARLLGIESPEPFGVYHGRKIGFMGRLTKPLSVDDAVHAIQFMNRPPIAILPFGKAMNETCAVISGGASGETTQAIEAGVDLYVSGETSHEIYHIAEEEHINVIAGGHYNTEVWGPRALCERTTIELGIETEFIDVPTGL